MTNKPHRPGPRCRRISWDHGKRRYDPHARFTCTCGASGNVHETDLRDQDKTPTKEKR